MDACDWNASSLSPRRCSVATGDFLLLGDSRHMFINFLSFSLGDKIHYCMARRPSQPFRRPPRN